MTSSSHFPIKIRVNKALPIIISTIVKCYLVFITTLITVNPKRGYGSHVTYSGSVGCPLRREDRWTVRTANHLRAQWRQGIVTATYTELIDRYGWRSRVALIEAEFSHLPGQKGVGVSMPVLALNVIAHLGEAFIQMLLEWLHRFDDSRTMNHQCRFQQRNLLSNEFSKLQNRIFVIRMLLLIPESKGKVPLHQ